MIKLHDQKPIRQVYSERAEESTFHRKALDIIPLVQKT